MVKCKTKTKSWGITNLERTCWYTTCVDRERHLFNNINNDINFFKVGMSDMPFWVRPHTKTAHGGAPWGCGKSLIQWIGVRFPNPFNGFRPKGYEHGLWGFLSGILNKLCAYPLCEGLGRGFFLDMCLRGKRG